MPAQTTPATPATQTKVLTADEIFKANDRKVEPVEVPEWGGTVFVRSMSSAERDAFEDASTGPDDKTNLKLYRARLVAATACGPDGQLMFTPSQASALGAKAAAAVVRLFAAAQRLNLMGQYGVEALKKNSAGTDSEGSPSGSP